MPSHASTRHCRAGRHPTHGSGDAELEPAGPAAGGVPPGAVDDAVGADGEHVDVLGEPRDRGDLTAWLAHAAGDVEPGGPSAGSCHQVL